MTRIGDRVTGATRSLTGRRTPSTLGLQRFAASYAVAAAADAFVDVSLAGSLFFSISPEASRQQVLLYLVINLIPFTFLAPLIGPAIDRFPRSHRLIATSIFVVRAALVIGMALTLFDLAFYFFTLALLIAGKASGVTKQALVPGLVDHPDHLVSANSKLARISLIAGSGAATVAVGLLAIASPYATLAVGCIGFLVAAVLAARLPDHAVVTEGEELAAVADHLQLHTPIVSATAWAFTMIRGAVGFFVFGIAFALRRSSEPAYVYAAVAAVWAVGTFAGNAIAPMLRRRTTEDRLTAGSLMALALVAMFGALGPSRVLIAIVAGVLGLAASIGRQGFDSLVQSRTPVTKRGGAFARYETRFQLGWVGGAIAATAVTMPARLAMATVAVSLLPAAIFYLRNVREVRRVGADDPLNPIALARRRIEHLVALDRTDHPGVAAVELASVANLVRTGGKELDADLIARVDALRDVGLSGAPPDADELDAAIEAMRAVIAGFDDQVVTEPPHSHGADADASTGPGIELPLFRARRAEPRTSP